MYQLVMAIVAFFHLPFSFSFYSFLQNDDQALLRDDQGARNKLLSIVETNNVMGSFNEALYNQKPRFMDCNENLIVGKPGLMFKKITTNQEQ